MSIGPATLGQTGPLAENETIPSSEQAPVGAFKP